ncbi:hypothetical protein CEP53_001291 [Fusarium sp. AF-6]|nr:hypothetical protein CEP53_001291 [Fusarium sp. AF-6]
MPSLKLMLEKVSRVPHWPPDQSNPTRHWGFTIYRTYYGPSSDDNWDKLLETAKKEAMEVLMKEGEDENGEKLKPFFLLDPRSDEALLSGVDRRGLIKIYKDQIGGPPMPTFQLVFLYADEDTLNQVIQGIFTLKAVDAEEEPREDIPPEEGDEFFGRPRYWGWMKMETRRIMELWAALAWSHTHHVITWTEFQANLEEVWEGWDAD